MFEVDPFWPKPLPNHWVLGAAVGVWVDAQDHVWMIHRGDNPNTIKGLEMKPPFSEMCCATAPLVLEFDQKGTLLRHWGPGPNDPWMDQEHGIHIDHKNNVWLGGGGGGDSQILKYTMDGKFVMQVGKKGARLRAGAARPINDPNSLDTESFGQPTKIVVDAKTNEAYVSDGYVNHRVVVLDADTGEFKRVWGAYGNKPDDTPVLGPLNPHRGSPTAGAAGRQGRGARSERASAAAVPQPRALRRHLQGRPGVCLRPAGRSPAGVHEGRKVREGEADPAEDHERRLGVGRGASRAIRSRRSSTSPTARTP